MESYALYLSRLHARLSTPEALVDAAVRRVTAQPIVSRRRIVAGEANEVYGIGLADRRPLIVRISRDRHKKFEQERWAVEQCRRLDVPVPEVRWIEHLSSETGPLDICVQEKLEGRVLSPDVIAATPRDLLRTLVVRLGNYLSRIHGIRIDGVEAPIQDLVHWDYWDGDCLPLEWLREGYSEASLFDEDYALRLHLGRLD